MSQNPLSIENAEMLHVDQAYQGLVALPGTDLEQDAPNVMDRLRGNVPELGVDLERAMRHTRGRFTVLGPLIEEAEANPVLDQRLADVYKLADAAVHRRLEAQAREAMAAADQQNQLGGWVRWVPERWQSTVRHWDGLRREAGMGASVVPTRNLEQRRLDRRVAEVIEQRFANRARFNQLDPADQQLVREEVGRLAPNYFSFNYEQLHQWANATQSGIVNPNPPAGGPANFTYYQLVERMMGEEGARSREGLTILARLQKGDATNQYRADFEAEYRAIFEGEREEKERDLGPVQQHYDTEMARRRAQEEGLKRQEKTVENSEKAPDLMDQILERDNVRILALQRANGMGIPAGTPPSTQAKIQADAGKEADKAEADIRAHYRDYERRYAQEMGESILKNLPAGTRLPQAVGIPEDILLVGALDIPAGQVIVLPEPLTLGGNTQIPAGESIRLPTALALQQPLVWPMGAPPLNIPGGAAFMPGSTIPQGTILPEGTSLPSDTILPQGMVLPRGTRLPQRFQIPSGTTLPRGLRLPQGTTIPAGTNLDFEDTYFHELPPLADLLAPPPPTPAYIAARDGLTTIAQNIRSRGVVLRQLYDTSKANWEASKDAPYSTTNCPHLYQEGYEDFNDLQAKHREAVGAVKTARKSEPTRDTSKRLTPHQLLYRLMDRELERQHLPFEDRQKRAVVGTMLLMDMVDTDVDEGWTIREAKRLSRSRIEHFFRRDERRQFPDFVNKTLIRQEKFKELKGLGLETTANQFLIWMAEDKVKAEDLPELMHQIELLSQDQLEGRGYLAFGADVRPLLNQIKLAWYRTKADELLKKTEDSAEPERAKAILGLMKTEPPKVKVPPPRAEHRAWELETGNVVNLREYKEAREKARDDAAEGSDERKKEERMIELVDKFGSIVIANASYALTDRLPGWWRNWRAGRSGGGRTRRRARGSRGSDSDREAA